MHYGPESLKSKGMLAVEITENDRQHFPEENYDTLEYSKVKCYSGNSVRLRNLYSIGHKKHQQ